MVLPLYLCDSFPMVCVAVTKPVWCLEKYQYYQIYWLIEPSIVCSHLGTLYYGVVCMCMNTDGSLSFTHTQLL